MRLWIGQVTYFGQRIRQGWVISWKNSVNMMEELGLTQKNVPPKSGHVN
jgi:hypothetical protein